MLCNRMNSKAEVASTYFTDLVFSTRVLNVHLYLVGMITFRPRVVVLYGVVVGKGLGRTSVGGVGGTGVAGGDEATA